MPVTVPLTTSRISSGMPTSDAAAIRNLLTACGGALTTPQYTIGGCGGARLDERPLSADRTERLRQIYVARVDRLADDRAFAPQGRWALQVVDGRQAARHDHGHRRGKAGDEIQKREDSLKVRAGQGSIAQDVGVHDARDPHLGKLLDEVVRRDARRLEPAFRRDDPATRIDTGDYAPTKEDDSVHQRRLVLDGGGPQDHAIRTRIPVSLNRGDVANTAANLHWDRDRGEDLPDRILIARGAIAGTVQIDYVEPLRPSVLPALRA